MNIKNRQKLFIQSKKRLVEDLDLPTVVRKGEEEGGCGVVGFCCSEPAAGKHIYEPSRLMHNRGNGKGGGIAAVGFVPEQMDVSRDVLDNYYMLHIAFLDNSVRADLEKKYIEPYFNVEKSSQLDKVDDWTQVPGLEVEPPDVWRYFVRVKDVVLDNFIAENDFGKLPRVEAEDEFIGQNSFRLNQEYYASLGEQKAFVLSNGKNIMILKVVGYAEAIVQYYKIEELKAHSWIAHQRFPTKGRVWHPGGAHPFAGVNMALVHNGDFANYHSVSEYLLQRHVYPQFLTDTEVSALMFDLLTRTYHYPLEYIIEAMAPTTELDFDELSDEKQKIYRAIQSSHMHGSPDGPWFFIVTRNLVEQNCFQLLGITDTAMLRPQVFSFSDGEVQVGVIGSEKQAMDSILAGLHGDDHRINPVADKYWNARGGSHSDGGAFVYTMKRDDAGKVRIKCTDKFGKEVVIPEATEVCDFGVDVKDAATDAKVGDFIAANDSRGLFEYVSGNVPSWTFDQIRGVCMQVSQAGAHEQNTTVAIEALTLLNDLRYPVGSKKRNHVIHIVRSELVKLFEAVPQLNSDVSGGQYRLVDFNTYKDVRGPEQGESVLVLNAWGFPAEGDECDAGILMSSYMKGWKKFIVFGCQGQRYVGCGLGGDTHDVEIDVYGSNGDYLASGIDGLTIRVHGAAQDQLGQIIKRGKLVVFGDVGQTFMYGAKGAEVYVMGNAAGRPLINSVGRPKVVINGTALDFLGESFMAGDIYNNGGFVILNGITFDEQGGVVALPEPYPGSNIFSLASGGAVFVRDPKKKMVDQQLNGGQYMTVNERDWELMVPLLEENQRQFGIKIDDLLTVDGKLCQPSDVYRKIMKAGVEIADDAKAEENVEDDDAREMAAKEC